MDVLGFRFGGEFGVICGCCLLLLVFRLRLPVIMEKREKGYSLVRDVVRKKSGVV